MGAELLLPAIIAGAFVLQPYSEEISDYIRKPNLPNQELSISLYAYSTFGLSMATLSDNDPQLFFYGLKVANALNLDYDSEVNLLITDFYLKETSEIDYTSRSLSADIKVNCSNNYFCSILSVTSFVTYSMLITDQSNVTLNVKLGDFGPLESVKLYLNNDFITITGKF